MMKWTSIHTQLTGLLLTVLVLLSACQKDDTPEPLDLGYGYYPTEVGTWVEYKIDSAWRDDLNQNAGEFSYLLREVITENYTDPAGRPAQRIMRFIGDSLGNWHIKDVWTTTMNATAAEKTEENVRLLKMVFPVRENQFWDLNVYNTENELEVTYEELHQPWALGGSSFDSTVVVRQTMSPNAIDTIIHEERYAKHVGLVSRRQVESNTQTWGTRGTYFRQQVTAYGRD